MVMTSRRFLLQLAAAGTSLAALQKAQAADLPAHEQALYGPAKAEGQLTWYTGQMQAEPSEAIGRAFTERFPGIKVNVVRSTSQVAFQRLAQDMRARVAQCDVFSSTDYSHCAFLKREDRLMAYKPRNADGLIEAARQSADPDGYFQITYLGLYSMARHTTRVSEADAPKSWKDLLDPRWRDQIAIGHPGYSGAITAWCVMMQKAYGWDYLKALERNRPLIGRSSADPVTAINAGERTIGAGLSSASALLSISRGNPITMIYPTDGTLAVPAPTGAMKDAPHPNAARLFMEFATSPAYHQAASAFFAESLRPEVAPPPGARALNTIPLITPSPEEVDAGGQEVKERWRDIFGV
jgi:iron(III) transport system substrate-binding protein